MSKLEINQDYFKTWSNNMAYIFGFWCAKGYVCNDTFNITISKKDKYILKRIANELQCDYVSIGTNYKIDFNNSIICNDLLDLNYNTLSFPDIPKRYLPDFIRGYFDGNGSIYQVKGNRINTAFTCGSEKFLFKLVDILKQEADLVGGSYDKSSYTYKFGKKDSILLGEYMYGNNPELFLLRKYKKFFN